MGSIVPSPHTNDNGYRVPDVTFRAPENRRIRIITIGAGFSGIMCAYQFEKHLKNVEHQIYEKNADIGGAWYENRYPGCACDVPAHAYAFNFALNPDWPKLYSEAPDIHKYLVKVTDTLDLRKYMKFHHRISSAVWNEDTGKWILEIQRTSSDGTVLETLNDECDFLIQASGLLNNYKWPDIEGMKDFQGRVVHTAAWPNDYQENQWKNDSVAIVGSGSSSLQTVATMQPHVKHLDIFVRTGVWFISLGANAGTNSAYTEEQIERLRNDKEQLVENAREFDCHANALWSAMFLESDLHQTMTNLSIKRMKEIIKDERLLQGFTPKFAWGCRRVTPGDPYMEAIQKPNVDVFFTPVVKVTKDGVIGEDSTYRKVDTIVCATGFDTSFRPAYKIVGEKGVDLADKWKDNPEGYLGVGVPGFPNLVSFFGPTWPVTGGSVVGSLNSVCHYAIALIRKIQEEMIKSMSPRQDVTDSFNEHTQALIKGMVWESSCRSWYKNNDTGRVNAIWPGSALHFQDVLSKPRWEDFEIKYQNTQNMWAFLGRGFTVAERNPSGDMAPYLKLEYLDERFYNNSSHKATNGLTDWPKSLKAQEEEGKPNTEEKGNRLTSASKSSVTAVEELSSFMS